MAQSRMSFDAAVSGNQAEDVHGDVVKVIQGTARDIRGQIVDIRQASVRDVEGQEVSIKQGSVLRLDAQDLTMTQGAVGIARADDARIGPGSAVGFVAGNSVKVEQSQLPVVAARGDVDLDQSLGGVVMASSVTMTQSTAGLVIAREVQGHVWLMVSPLAAAAFGVGVGLVLGLIRYGMHLRKHPPRLPEINNPLKRDEPEPDVITVIRRRLQVIHD